MWRIFSDLTKSDEEKNTPKEPDIQGNLDSISELGQTAQLYKDGIKVSFENLTLSECEEELIRMLEA